MSKKKRAANTSGSRGSRSSFARVKSSGTIQLNKALKVERHVANNENDAQAAKVRTNTLAPRTKPTRTHARTVSAYQGTLRGFDLRNSREGQVETLTGMPFSRDPISLNKLSGRLSSEGKALQEHLKLVKKLDNLSPTNGRKTKPVSRKIGTRNYRVGSIGFGATLKVA